MDWQELFHSILTFLTSSLQIIYWYLEAAYHLIVPPPLKSIEKEVILVTGACGGIGSEICKSLVRSATNLKLVLCDLTLADLNKLAKQLNSINTSAQIFSFEVDLSSRENIEKCCQEIKTKAGSVTILFNNAGISARGNFLQIPDDQIDKVYQVNLMSHLWLIRKVLPDMVMANHGRIINICSMGGIHAAPNGFPYFSSKFAVNGYTESLKLELMLFQNTGIHVTTVYPYFVQTKIIRSLTLGDEMKSTTPSAYHKILDPVEVGKKIVEGMRREYEYIYLPWGIPLFMLFQYFIPMKLRKMMDMNFFGNIKYKDANDSKLTETFKTTISK